MGFEYLVRLSLVYKGWYNYEVVLRIYRVVRICKGTLSCG